MRKVLRIVSTIGVLVMASGCGGSSATIDSVVTTESVSPIETTTTQTPVLPADLAEYTIGFGCVKYEKNPTPIQYVAVWGYCKFEDVTIQLYAFANQQDRDAFVEMLVASGGRVEDTVTDGLMVLAPDSAAKIEPLKKALGM